MNSKRKQNLTTAGIVAGGALLGKMVGAGSVAGAAVGGTTTAVAGAAVAGTTSAVVGGAAVAGGGGAVVGGGAVAGGITFAPILLVSGAMLLVATLLSDAKKSLAQPQGEDEDEEEEGDDGGGDEEEEIIEATLLHVDGVADENPCTFEQLALMNDAEKKVYVARLLHKSPADPSHRVSMRADECQICLGAGVSPDVLFLPCGHLAACSACELSWLVTMLNQRIAGFAVQTLCFTRETVMNSANLRLLLSKYSCFYCRQVVQQRVDMA